VNPMFFPLILAVVLLVAIVLYHRSILLLVVAGAWVTLVAMFVWWFA
jgi:hypothetical protein